MCVCMYVRSMGAQTGLPSGRGKYHVNGAGKTMFFWILDMLQQLFNKIFVFFYSEQEVRSLHSAPDAQLRSDYDVLSLNYIKLKKTKILFLIAFKCVFDYSRVWQ